MLLQIFLRNFYSNASCFSLVWLYLGNSQVSVDRTIGPTLVLYITASYVSQDESMLYYPCCCCVVITNSIQLLLQKEGE